jgi:NTE family protein
MWSIPVDRTSFDAIEKVREQLTRWQAAGPASGPDQREAYLSQVTFEGLTDPTERKYFTAVKTSLALPHDQVDKLREVSGRLLRQTPSFKRLLADLEAGHQLGQ